MALEAIDEDFLDDFALFRSESVDADVDAFRKLLLGDDSASRSLADDPAPTYSD